MNKPLGRPPVSNAPDVEKWEAEHGAKPYPVENVPASLVRRARLQTEKDWSTIDPDECHRIHANLDCICEEIEVPPDCLVWFNPDDNRFWAYPESSRK